MVDRRKNTRDRMNSILYRSILQDAFVEKVWEDDKLEVIISSF